MTYVSYAFGSVGQTQLSYLRTHTLNGYHAGYAGYAELCTPSGQGQYLCPIHASLCMEQWTMHECMEDTCELNAALTRAFLKLEDDIFTCLPPEGTEVEPSTKRSPPHHVCL